MSQTICEQCGVPSDATHCPLCTLKMQVEELRQRVTRLERNTALVVLELKERVIGLEMKRIESITVSASPLEPKLYSGFTLEEWELMFRDGPLLLEAGRLELWFDAFRGGYFIGGVHKFQDDEVELIEQPNWRPHRTDGCPVPGRVRVEVGYKRSIHCCWETIGKADEFCWEYEAGIRAYRILGT